MIFIKLNEIQSNTDKMMKQNEVAISAIRYFNKNGGNGK
jgi:hypothetical protein